MSERIEPPILMSRLMTFVFSAALVVVIVLVVTLVKMFPLNKTQIFFLTTQPRSDLQIKLSAFSPEESNLDVYKQAFIKEYIKARNEIVPSAAAMQKKWSAAEDGIVYTWSTPEVYAAFADTAMWTAYMNDTPDFVFSCPVEFQSIAPRAKDTYAATFSYFCTNADEKVTKKDFTIVLKLELENTIKWTDRLNNPLGIRVSEYSIESGNGDPLDFK